MTRPATFAELEETWKTAYDDFWRVASTGLDPVPEGPPWVRAGLALEEFKVLLRMRGLRIAPHHACTGATADTVPFEKRPRE